MCRKSTAVRDVLGRPNADGQYLFNLCLQFGLDNTALALLEHGVEGCRLEWKDLDRFARKSWSWGHYGYVRCACPSGSWQTCDGCSWGFGRENDVWMPDWDESLEDAKATALDVAEMPFTEALLTAIRSDNCLPGLEVADEVWARLLDIAVLLGDKDLASQCAPRCPWTLQCTVAATLCRVCTKGFPETPIPLH